MTNAAVALMDAGSVAARILVEWKESPKNELRNELAWTYEMASLLPLRSTLEMERMEVLEGAIESLQSNRPERIKAALYVLNHLATAQASR